MRLASILVAVGIILCSHVIGAERSTIVVASDLIVVGRLEVKDSASTPAGWRLQGKISIDSVIAGTPVGLKTVDYDFVCSCCRGNVGRELQAFVVQRAVWLLKKNRADSKWTSAGECSDPGLRPLSDLEYIKSVKSTVRRQRL
jgi:hypothetical protein